VAAGSFHSRHSQELDDIGILRTTRSVSGGTRGLTGPHLGQMSLQCHQSRAKCDSCGYQDEDPVSIRGGADKEGRRWSLCVISRSVWQCCLVKVRRPGTAVIFIQPPAAATGSNFFVIKKLPAELV